VANDRNPAQRRPPDLDAQIAELTGRVFKRLEGWAKMALVATLGLGAIAFLLGLAAFDGLRTFPLVAIWLLVVLIPAIAAWVIGRRAVAVHRSVDGIRRDLRTALADPEISHAFDGFVGATGANNDGRAALAQLAQGALGVRKLVAERRESFVDLAGAVRAMVMSPALLVTITAGLLILALVSLIFGLIAIF
jgi:hypothetical protein